MVSKNKKKGLNIWKDNRFYLLGVMTILMLAIVIQLFMLQILPMLYTMIIIVVFVILWFLFWLLLYNKKINRFNRNLGKVIIVIVCLGLVVGNFYVYKGGETLRNISGSNIKTDAISVIVLKDNDAEKINDLKDSKFGIMEKTDRENTDLAIEDINKQVSNTINTKTYLSANDLAQALYDENINAIILNEGFRNLFDEKFPEFDNETKVIYQFEIETEIKEISKDVDVTKDSFNVFISGIDTFGSVSASSRSDVNMVATVNPKTHDILLTSIPRDYYVSQSCQGGQEDKLTHAGIFGVDCSVDAIENLLGIQINYYARVNFTSLINIIDALGGVNVENPNEFYGNLGNYYGAGSLYLDGEHALEFSRERYSFSDGDRERGRNQMRVIEGIINKAISPSIIVNYTGVMNAISGSFQTNMDSSDITKFIQQQLNSMSSWNIIQNSLNGTGSDNTWSPANGFNSYVMIPDQESVTAASNEIHQIMDGQSAISN